MPRPAEVQRVAIECQDGSVAVMEIVVRIAEGGLAAKEAKLNGYTLRRGQWERLATDEVIAAEVSRSLLPSPAIKWRRISAAEIPTDRQFRNAWHDDGDKIGHDLVKAREIHRNLLRRERAGRLADLDTEYMRADEAGDTAKKLEVAAKKQMLRDITADPRIEAAKSVEELKQVKLPE